MSEKPWTADQVAERLGITRFAVYRLAKSGQLPAHVIGTRYRFEPADVEAFWVRCRIGSETKAS